MLEGRPSCEDRAVEQLRAMLSSRLDYLEQDGESWFDAMQNARIVRAAERYYRAMYRSSTESWNLRDRHMFETLQALLAHRGDGAKAVVWAHNSHIGNAAATAMGWQGRSEEHTSELQSLMRISYAVFCLKKKKKNKQNNTRNHYDAHN